MLLKWDTVLGTLQPEQAKEITEEVQKEMDRQEGVFSLHPTQPHPVTYVGSKLDKYGYAYDYYRDSADTYWHESRAADEPIVTHFRYGGGVLCQRGK